MSACFARLLFLPTPLRSFQHLLYTTAGEREEEMESLCSDKLRGVALRCTFLQPCKKSDSMFFGHLYREGGGGGRPKREIVLMAAASAAPLLLSLQVSGEKRSGEKGLLSSR